MRTNSMAVLDDKKRLGSDDFVSFRVVEDRDNESQHLRVNDNGELEVPYIGLVPASGKTCDELAYNIKAALEREYYYHATVILAVDQVSEKSRGKIYVYGAVKGQGPQEIPPDEIYTVSKAIIRAGGFGDFADKRKIKITRKRRPRHGGRSEASHRARPHGGRCRPAARRSNLRPAAAGEFLVYAESRSRTLIARFRSRLRSSRVSIATRRFSFAAGGFRS